MVIDDPAAWPIPTLYESVFVVKFCVSNAPAPIAIFLSPLVSNPKAPVPTATFESPSVRASPANPPMRVFESPMVTDLPASLPTAVL